MALDAAQTARVVAALDDEHRDAWFEILKQGRPDLAENYRLFLWDLDREVFFSDFFKHSCLAASEARRRLTWLLGTFDPCWRRREAD